jgi:hypothetical protein
MDVHDITPPVYRLNGFEIAVLTIIIILIIACFVWKWWTQFSDEELSELSDTMMYFHKNPNRDDFMQVWGERTRLIRHTGRPVRFWCYGVYLKHPEFYTDEQKHELVPWIHEIERGLRRIKNNPSSLDLDCVWSLYFATGDIIYSNIIKNIALDESLPYHIRSGARWSYRSIMKQKPDPPASAQEPDEPTEPAEAPDVIILPDTPAEEPVEKPRLEVSIMAAR